MTISLLHLKSQVVGVVHLKLMPWDLYVGLFEHCDGRLFRYLWQGSRSNLTVCRQSYVNEFFHNSDERTGGRKDLSHIMDERKITFSGGSKRSPEKIVDQNGCRGQDARIQEASD